MSNQTYYLSSEGDTSSVITLSQGDTITWQGSLPVVIRFDLGDDDSQTLQLDDEESFVAPVDGDYTVTLDLELSCNNVDQGTVIILKASKLSIPATRVCLRLKSGDSPDVSAWAIACGTCEDSESLSVSLFNLDGSKLENPDDYFIL